MDEDGDAEAVGEGDWPTDPEGAADGAVLGQFPMIVDTMVLLVAHAIGVGVGVGTAVGVAVGAGAAEIVGKGDPPRLMTIIIEIFGVGLAPATGL
jgi:hypothetical protein